MKLVEIFKESSHYGSLINKQKYDAMDSADKALYKYTADSYTSIVSHFEKLVEKYPFAGGKIYRGLHFDTQEEFETFMDSISSGSITIKSISSWTRNLKTAKGFSLTKKTYFPTLDIMWAEQSRRESGEHMTGYSGIVLKTTIPKNKAIDVNKTAYAKEDEIILPAGEYEVSIELKSEPFKLKYKDDVNQALSDIKSGKDTNSIIEWLIHSKLNELTSEQMDLILLTKYKKMFTIKSNEILDKTDIKITSDFNKGAYVNIEIPIPVIDETLYEKASSKFKSKYVKLLKSIDNELLKKLSLIEIQPEQITHIEISELKRFKNLYPDSRFIIAFKKLAVTGYNLINNSKHVKQNKIPIKHIAEVSTSLVKIMSI